MVVHLFVVIMSCGLDGHLCLLMVVLHVVMFFVCLQSFMSLCALCCVHILFMTILCLFKYSFEVTEYLYFISCQLLVT